MPISNITSFMDLKMTIENIEQIYSDAKELSIGVDVSKNIFTETKSQADILFNKYFLEKFMLMTVNLNGHSKGKYDNKTISEIKTMPYEEHFVDSLKGMFTINFSKLIRDIIENKKTKEEILKKFEEDLEYCFHNPTNYCFSCGCTNNIYINGNEFNLFANYEKLDNYPSQKPCKFPNGVGVDTLYMEFNSGKMVIANDLRSLFEDKSGSNQYITDKSGYYNSINSDYGVQLNTRYWAEKGMVYLQVGNSSPGIFVKKGGTIIFKDKYTYNRETDKETKNYTIEEKYKGYVCTDLWAICAMDYNLFLELCKKQEIDPEEFLDEQDCTVIKSLPKGIYKIADQTAICKIGDSYKDYGSIVYTTIESRTEDPDFKGLEDVYPIKK
jgi:hypothetical protein